MPRCLTCVGAQRLAVPLPDAAPVTIALISDAMDVLLPGISDLVEGLAFGVLALVWKWERSFILGMPAGCQAHGLHQGSSALPRPPPQEAALRPSLAPSAETSGLGVG